MSTPPTEAEKHQRRVDAVCVWLGWTAVDRNGVRCWQHFITGIEGSQIAVHEPVSSWDPWKYREDLHWVLRAALAKGLGWKLAKAWLYKSELSPESLVRFAAEEPREIMQLVVKLMKG